MNGKNIADVIAMILIFCMIHLTVPTYAEDKIQTVTVDASEADKTVTVGNVDAEHFGIHVRAENGHTALVNAENVRAGFVENLPNAALYVLSKDSGSFAKISTKNLEAEEAADNFGANIVVMNGGQADINSGIVSGNTGVEITAEGKNSSVIVTTGDLHVNQYGLNVQSNDYAEIEVSTGMIHSYADGILNPYYAMAGNGGKVRITSLDVISENDFGVGGFVSGTDSELSLKSKNISAEIIAMDLSAETGGKVYAEAENVTVDSTSTNPYSPMLTRRGVGGHSKNDGSNLEFRISGSVFLSEIGNNTDENLKQQPSEGVFATSSDVGNTIIRIEKDVTVRAEKTQTIVSGIRAENTGGTIIVSTGSDVSAEVPNSQKAYGLYIINDASDANDDLFPVSSENESRYPIASRIDPYQKNATESRTEISIHGDLSGSAYGLYFKPGADIQADVLVTGTISGGSAGILVDEGTDSENLNLTVWSIPPNSAGCAAVNTDGSCADEVEAAIKYIIKVRSPQINYSLTDQYGNLLETPHGYPAAKAGETVCLHTDTPGSSTNLTKTVKNSNCIIVPKGGGVILTAKTRHTVDFYRILDDEGKLPATGFSAVFPVILPLRPQELDYGTTGLTLQIPKLDVMKSIVTVPMSDGSYPVEWLESDIGLLEGSTLPGEGFSVLTGHNHLNTTEAGPFLFLSTLEENDLILVTDNRGNSQNFHVRGNHLIDPDGLNTLGNEITENTLMLVTCEDEAVDGGYLHRRVILAEKM